LLAKAFTFLPLGSIAFKVNLFSLVFACLTLVFLYLSTNLFLEIVFGPGESRTLASLFPALLMAFSEPFWYHALVAEVYTLHAFFTCLIIYLLLQWKMKEDLRFLYAVAFFYGLSAGNHATVAFYLPAIVLLFFAWERKARFKNLLVSSLIFLIGFSVYLYLPIRSLAEPTIDWGNPETFQGFLYQITDRQHAETHFEKLSAGNPEKTSTIWPDLSLLGTNTLYVLKKLTHDLNKQLTPVVIIGFFAGALLCFKANRPLFFFLLLIVAVNASFFAGWRKESYFPSYIVACLWTSVFLYWLLQAKWTTNSSPDAQGSLVDENRSPANLQVLISLVLVGCVAWQASANYSKVDRSGHYFAESLLQRMILSLDDNSIFVAGISWFNSAYHQDVMRLRDDVTFVKAWDFLDAHPPSLMTPKKYPDLKLPAPKNHRFDSRAGSYSYAIDFFERNSRLRPLLIEQNTFFLREFPLAEKLVPHGNLLLRYRGESRNSLNPGKGFGEFKTWLEEELSLPGIQNESMWIQKVSFYIPSFAAYFHSAGYYKEEREALMVMYEFLGQRGPGWHLKMVDNLTLDGKPEEARKKLEPMRKHFPEFFATHLATGRVLQSEGNYADAIQSFDRALEVDPEAFRPHLEKSLAWLGSGNKEKTISTLIVARKKIKTLNDLKQLENVEKIIE